MSRPLADESSGEWNLLLFFLALDKVEIADSIQSMKSKPHLNVGIIGHTPIQGLGRLFRMSRQNPVVAVPPSVDSLVLEAVIAARIHQRLVILGETTESTGKSLMEGLDLPGNSDTL